jgi:hypothetical protein
MRQIVILARDNMTPALKEIVLISLKDLGNVQTVFRSG